MILDAQKIVTKILEKLKLQKFHTGTELHQNPAMKNETIQNKCSNLKAGSTSKSKMVHGGCVPNTPAKKGSLTSRGGLRHKTIHISVNKCVPGFLLGWEKST